MRHPLPVGVLSAVLGGVAGAYAAVQLVNEDEGSTSSAPLELTINEEGTLEDGDIPYPADVYGNVSGLGPGQVVWAFYHAVGGNDYFPGPRPCVVSDEKWVCQDFFIGGPESTMNYEVLAAVVNDVDIGQIADRLRCDGTDLDADPKNDCDAYFEADALPVGEDPQDITGNRAEAPKQ